MLPFLVLNLGSEMIYILDQRLRSQDIPPDRKLRVLRDITQSMFSQKFLSELFRPQAMYSMVSTRQIFQKLAHSSIMKLNETSMQKLFDLMLMGLKYQTQQSVQPEEIFHFTVKHLNLVLKLVENSEAVTDVENALRLLTEMCKNFNAYDYQVVRQQIYKFFEDRHIKVSLFIQDKIQGLDGSVFLDFCGVGPYKSRKPGHITFYNDQQAEIRSSCVQLVHSEKW